MQIYPALSKSFSLHKSCSPKAWSSSTTARPLPLPEFAHRTLAAGDRLEIVKIVAGG